MNKKDIQKYFDRRPACEELHVVGNIVFTNLGDAKAYSELMGLAFETKRRDDTDTSTSSVTEATGINTSEGIETDASATEPEQTPAPAKKKNSTRKNTGK